MMRTGYNRVNDGSLPPHVTAIIRGASAVFAQQLCRDLTLLKQLTDDTDLDNMARACAYRILQTDKCKRLEQLVADVINSPDGMPDVQDKALLAEVLAIQSEARRTQRTGVQVPAFIENASAHRELTEDDAIAFIHCINLQEEQAATFQPSTPFQYIVCGAINNVPI